MHENPSVDWQERAESNERLRRMLTEELESTRDELTAATADSTRTRAEMLQLHTKLNAEMESVRQEAAEREAAGQEGCEAVQHDLDQARAELAAARDTIQRQEAHIKRLKQQIARPVRILAKKVLRRGTAPSRGDAGDHDG